MLGERLVHTASEFRQEPDYDRTHIAQPHSTKYDYAPPVILESDLIAVTFQLLQKIRTANKICYAVRIHIALTVETPPQQLLRGRLC